jgi:hypothetical protein
MSFGKGLIRGVALFAALGMAAAASPGFAQTTKQTKAPAPTPATERGLSNIDLVNKALNPGASDPDVPLPHPDLAKTNGDTSASAGGPQVYGRQEQGGGVFGFRVPIPADRNSTGRSY